MAIRESDLHTDKYLHSLTNRHRTLRSMDGDSPHTRAADTIVESIQRHERLQVVKYQPYIDEVRGEEGSYRIASQYMSVVSHGQEAWFEVIRPASQTPTTEIKFLVQPRLDIILASQDNEAVEQFHTFLASPAEGQAFVRVVEHEESPFPQGELPRITDPELLKKACEAVSGKLLPRTGRRKEQSQELPSVTELTTFLEDQEAFDPIFTASNGISIGKGRVIKGHVEGADQVVTVFPTQNEKGERASLLVKGEATDTAHTRMDFYCSCQKTGKRAEGHACGHELLGSLQQGDAFTVIAWGGQDCRGNGSVFHSLKQGNLTRLNEVGYTSPTQSLRRGIEASLAKLPYAEQREFPLLAEALAAGVEAFNVKHLILDSGNNLKIGALQDQLSFMYPQDQPDITVQDAAAKYVPDSIQQKDVAARRKLDKKTYGSCIFLPQNV